MTKHSRAPAGCSNSQQPKRCRVPAQSTNAKETRSLRGSSNGVPRSRRARFNEPIGRETPSALRLK